MTSTRLRLLLRRRAEVLAVPEAVLTRALSRCARQSRRVKSLTESPIPSAPILSDAPETGMTEPELGVTEASRAGAAAPTPQRGALAAGRIIAGYRIEQLLGKGGMGSVYRALQLSMNRQVAFKVLAPRYATDPTFVGRFKREARAAGRLHHPNLITVHEWGEADGLVFFSMELVEGRSLKERLVAEGPIPAEQLLPLMRQVLEALQYAHGKGVIHRDIKPDNLMVSTNGQVKIADLGLSRVDEPRAGETTELFETGAGSFMGTPHYMSPEQGQDAHKVDQRSDLYSLGATMYHLLYGHPPFEGTTAMAILVAAQSVALTWPEPRPARPLRELITKLMEKDPAKRPADAAATIALLDRVQNPQGRSATQRRRWSVGMILTWLIAVMVAVALILAALRFAKEREIDRGWSARSVEIQKHADGKEFLRADEALVQARAFLPPGNPHHADCDKLRSEIESRWDEWAKQQMAGIFSAFQQAKAAGRYEEAAMLLEDKVPKPYRSPAIEREIERLLKELLAEAARQAAAPRAADAPPERAALLDFAHKYNQRREAVILQLWSRATLAPAGSFERDGTRTRFHDNGQGTFHIPAPFQATGAVPVEWRWVWRGRPAPTAAWTMDLGGSRRLVVRPSGVELETPTGRALIARADGAVVRLLVLRQPQGIGFLGNQKPEKIEGIGPDLPINWTLDSDGLTMELEVRPPKRMPDQLR